MTRRSLFAACAAALSSSLAATAQDAPAPDLLVRAARVVVATDTVLEPGALLVRQGRIAWVGSEIPADAAARATLVDYGTATVVPGFVLAHATLSQDDDLVEASLPFTPDLRAAEAFDPWNEELKRLPPAGVTSFALSPSPRNVAAGIAALAKPATGAAAATRGIIVVPELHLVLSLAGAARNPERQPTSLMGAVDLLRTTFAAARTGTHAGPDAAVLRQVTDGSRPAFVHADSFAELSQALDLARDFGFEPVLVGAADAEKVLPRLVRQKAAIVLGTLAPDARLPQLQLPTKLAEAGVPFCFAGEPAQLRLSAALAVRHGLDRRTALQALTHTPAVLLDQQGNVGTLRQGQAADFLVFTGDPLDLDSVHVATWIDGVLRHGDEDRPAPPPSAPTGAAAAAHRSADR